MIIAPKEGLSVANLSAALLAMQNAFTIALDQLAEANGSVAGQWLDDLEKVVTREAKGTVTEDISIEVEASSVKLGIDVLQATLDIFRDKLARASNKE